MSGFTLANVRVLEPGEGVVGDLLRVEKGRVAEIGVGDVCDRQGVVINGGGRVVTPGLVDVHTHRDRAARL